MAAYDRTITLAASPEVIATFIQRSVSLVELRVIEPARMLLTLRGEWGMVYVLHPDEDGKTQLRMLMDSAENVRKAFDGKSARDALLELLKLPADMTSGIAEKAVEHLEKLKQASEHDVDPFQWPMTASAPYSSAYSSVYDTVLRPHAVQPPRSLIRRIGSFFALCGGILLMVFLAALRGGFLKAFFVHLRVVVSR